MKFKPRDQWAKPTKGPLPSRFQHGDPVIVYFGTAGIIKNCTVIKIHFAEDKVFYDVEVKWKHLETADNYSKGVDIKRVLTDRLYNLDSAVVFSPDDFEAMEPKNATVIDQLVISALKESLKWVSDTTKMSSNGSLVMRAIAGDSDTLYVISDENDNELTRWTE